jgi:hypothetical protein
MSRIVGEYMQTANQAYHHVPCAASCRDHRAIDSRRVRTDLKKTSFNYQAPPPLTTDHWCANVKQPSEVLANVASNCGRVLINSTSASHKPRTAGPQQRAPTVTRGLRPLYYALCDILARVMKSLSNISTEEALI